MLTRSVPVPLHGITLLGIALLGSCVAMVENASAQDSVWSVKRSTRDRDLDLVHALVQRERYEEALSLCQMQSLGVDPQGDQAAKWAVERSRVLVARQMGEDRFDDADIQAAAKPVLDLMAAYPEHQRRLFLTAQQLHVRRHAALHRVLRAAVSPADQGLRDQATIDLLRVTEDLQDLIKEVQETRVVLDQAKENRPDALIGDLFRLQQSLQVEAVSLALMQTELFKPGSDDCIAAATRAEQIADQAITGLPEDTQARSEVERLRTESIVRAGQFDRADRAMESLSAPQQTLRTPRWRALQVRLDLAQQRFQEAEKTLNDFYGSDPKAAPRSVEMDLARLEFLLRRQPGQEVGGWLDAIQQRGGRYARRRAEALALSLLGSRDPETMPVIDPSIIAAQGQQYLRQGDPRRGAELLAAAAAAESDGGRAIQRALEAAAAFGSAKLHQQAAEVLSETALANVGATTAPAAHLQAAFLVASHPPQSAEQLESMLRRHLTQWPAAETAAAARAWLVKLLNGQQRFLDAAEITTAVPVDQWTPQTVESSGTAWQTAFRRAEDESTEISKRFLAAFEPLRRSPLAAEIYPRLAALLVDREFLSAVVIPSEVADRHPFAMGLLDFRARGTTSPALSTPPSDWVDKGWLDDAAERLMRDGRQAAAIRPAVAKLVAQWPLEQRSSVDQAECLLWLGQMAAAVKLLDEWVLGEPNSVDRIQQAAQLLESAELVEADREAVRLWDQLAAGVVQGSQSWHEAKLAGIAALRRAGNLQESQRRARYILLTLPNLEASWRSQYETFSQ